MEHLDSRLQGRGVTYFELVRYFFDSRLHTGDPLGAKGMLYIPLLEHFGLECSFLVWPGAFTPGEVCRPHAPDHTARPALFNWLSDGASVDVSVSRFLQKGCHEKTPSSNSFGADTQIPSMRMHCNLQRISKLAARSGT